MSVKTSSGLPLVLFFMFFHHFNETQEVLFPLTFPLTESETGFGSEMSKQCERFGGDTLVLMVSESGHPDYKVL